MAFSSSMRPRTGPKPIILKYDLEVDEASIRFQGPTGLAECGSLRWHGDAPSHWAVLNGAILDGDRGTCHET